MLIAPGCRNVEYTRRRDASALRRLPAVCLAGPLAQLVVPDSASAQDRPIESPEDLVRQEQLKGIPFGSFKLLPKINFDLRADSNIYDQQDGKRSDEIAVVRPAFTIDSDFARHSVRLDAAAEGRRYFKTPEENSNQWMVAGSGRLDFANRYELSGKVGVAGRIERRGTFGDQFRTDSPVSYRDVTAEANLSRSGRTIEWQVGVDTHDLKYRDASEGGVRVDQGFRDVRTSAANLRVEYRGFSRLGLFAQTSGNKLDYARDKGRNSTGYSVLGGATYRVTDLVKVEAGIGYMQQNVRDRQFGRYKGVDYHASVDWTPRSRVRFELEAARNVQRSPLEEGGAVLQSTLTARSAVAVGSRTLVGVEGGFLRNSYEGVNRREQRVFAEATVRHFVTRGVVAFAAASARQQRGSGIGPREYRGATIRMGVTFAV